MCELLLPKYSFADITVFMKSNDSNYLNLTDFDISDEDNERLSLGSDSPYVLMFCSFIYYKCREKNDKLFACDVSIEDLMKLAGISDRNFFKRFCSGEDGNEKLLAALCAKKILDYRYGRAVKEQQYTYSFFRQYYKKDKALVLQKKFYEV